MDNGTTDVLIVIVTEPDTSFAIATPEGLLSGRSDSQGRSVNAVPEDILPVLEAQPPMYVEGVESLENLLEYEVHRADEYFRQYNTFDDVEHAVIAAKALGYGVITTCGHDKPWQRIDHWNRRFRELPDSQYLLIGNRLYKIQAGVRFLGYDDREGRWKGEP